MILYAACLYLIYKSTKNYKNSILLFFAIFCFMTRNVRIVFVPLSTLTISWFAFLLFLKRKKYRKRIYMFPWKNPFTLLGISITISSLFSITGFASEATTLLGNILKDIILIIILWCCVENRNDFFRLYGYLSIVFFISCIYGFIEYLLQSNPLQTYLGFFAGISDATIWTYDSSSIRGYRICSIFEHPIGAAINWSMYAVFTIYLYIRRSEELKHKIFNIITATLSIICVFLTKCRSPLLFFIIFSLILILQFKQVKFWKLITLAAPFLVVGGYWALTQSSALQSIVDIVFFGGTGQMGAGSSSLTLRGKQINTAFNLMKLSPIYGLGTQYRDVLSASLTYYILGGESLLISIPPAYGILGLITHGVMIAFDTIIIPCKYKSKECFILGLAYWLVQFFTSIPGTLPFIYYLFMIYFIKINREWSVET